MIFKIKNKLSSVLLIAFILLLNSCSPSACDCANLYNNGPMKKKYSYSQLNDSDFLRQEASKHVQKAKSCAIKFGELSDFEKELARDVLEMNMIPGLDKAIRNAKKECASNKSYSKEEVEIACDCWNQSVKKSGKAYDNMSKSEQEFRMKCFDIFSVEDAMREACESVSKNN